MIALSAWLSTLSAGERILLGLVAWFLVTALSGAAWGWWHVSGHEPPWRERQRRRRRALRELEPLPPVWPAKNERGGEWP